MATTAEKIRERRLDRMRAGQSVCEFVHLPSDSEIRLAIVPLTEAEYNQALEAIAAMEGIDNVSTLTLKDRRLSQEIILRAIREESDLSQRLFHQIEDMMEVLDVGDVDEIITRYNEMMDKSSPAIDGISPQEMEDLKKDFLTMDWNGLSGQAWYALKRFLFLASPTLQQDKSPGSG